MSKQQLQQEKKRAKCCKSVFKIKISEFSAETALITEWRGKKGGEFFSSPLRDQGSFCRNFGDLYFKYTFAAFGSFLFLFQLCCQGSTTSSPWSIFLLSFYSPTINCWHSAPQCDRKMNISGASFADYTCRRISHGISTNSAHSTIYMHYKEDFKDTSSFIPVSYTHLTLPTILLV